MFKIQGNPMLIAPGSEGGTKNWGNDPGTDKSLSMGCSFLFLELWFSYRMDGINLNSDMYLYYKKKGW